MKVTLKQDVKGSGKQGDVIEVSDGYAKNFLLKKHIKENLFEYALDVIITIALVVIILILCDGENFILGIILAAAFSLGKTVHRVLSYKKIRSELSNKTQGG